MPVEQCLAHVTALRRYARLLTGDGHRADDLVQDTLERACARFASYRDGTDLKAWMLTLMHNLHANRRRDFRHDDQAVGLDEVAEPAHEPMTRTAQRLDLQRALARMTPAAREVLLLATVEEYTYAEIATILEVPVGTVMSRLHRAREQLRLLMDPDGPDAERLVRPPLVVVTR